MRTEYTEEPRDEIGEQRDPVVAHVREIQKILAFNSNWASKEIELNKYYERLANDVNNPDELDYFTYALIRKIVSLNEQAGATQ